MKLPEPKWLAVGAAALAVVGLVAWVAAKSGTGATDGEPASRGALETDADSTVRLLYPNGAGRLGAEERALAATGERAERVRAIVAAYLEGPDTAGLFRAFPEGVEVGPVLLKPDGTVYLDLLSTDHPAPPAAGSHQELLTVYSLVNTLLVNEPSLNRVVVLWNGRQRDTLAGHIDLTHPLGLRRDLIADATGSS